MANIFLSYDRDDEARARPITALLERAGHDVWWDRQIKGGHEFGAEIEAALEAADKVVVLWSQQAVRSAWVRDEAAVGRDTGRLVPVTIDGTPAPLGFRQFQTIDLSTWKGRSSSPEVKHLLGAVDTAAPADAPAQRPMQKRRKFTLSWPALIGGGGVLALAVGALVWHFWPAGPGGTPTFAIVSAEPSPSSNQLAADVLARVAGFNDPSSAEFHVADASSSVQDAYALKINSGSADGSGRALTLVSGRNNAVLWSKPLAIAGSQDQFAQVAAVNAQHALSCAAEALSYRREPFDQETLKLYLSGCTRLDDAYGINAPDPTLPKLFESIIAKAPHFAPAWSKLFAAEVDGLYSADRDTVIPQVRSQIDRARQLGIDVGEIYAAKAGLLSPGDFLGVLRTFDDGIAKHPDNAMLYRVRGERLADVGRMNESVADSSQAVNLGPLSAANLEDLASALAYAGETEAAYEQLRKAERLWPDAMAVIIARYRMDLRFGDPKEAQALYRKYVQVVGNPAQATFIEARIDPTPEKIEEAIDAERKLNAQFPPFISSLIQALGYFGHKDEAIDLLMNYPGSAPSKYREWIGFNAEVLFRPMMRNVWRDPRSMAAAAHVGLLHYWKASGHWPDFCFDPTLPYDCKKEATKYPV